jgi:hypothetical protein
VGNESHLNYAVISKSFFALRRMCLEDAKVWDILERRRNDIHIAMFSSIFIPRAVVPSDCVWVETAELRKFLSCKDGYNSCEDAPLQYQRLLCSHSDRGIHPRVARRGKLLSRDMYEAYILLVSKALGSELSSDVTLTPSNIFCQECSQDYRRELSDKLNFARTALRLHENLDPKNDKNFSLVSKPDEHLTHESDKYAYVVSRKFITAFRVRVARLMKSALAIEGTAKSIDKVMTSASSSCETLLEGLDALDLAILTEDDTLQDDLVVNESITCTYGF